MKFLFTCLLFISSSAFAYTFENSGCTTQQIDQAREEARVAQSRLGEITLVDVNVAKMKVLETIFCAEQPNPTTITCPEMTGKMDLILTEMYSEKGVGQRTDQEYGEALKKAGELYIFCSRP